MKQNYKNRLMILPLLVLVVIPQVVSAAWWNPLSWFTRPVPKTEVFETKLDSNSTTTQTIASSTPKEVQIRVVPAISETKSVQEDLEARLQQEILNARLKVEDQLEIERQTRLEATRIQQATDRANEEARINALKIEAEKQVSEEAKDTTLTINDVSCSWGGSDDVYILAFSIEGPWASGLISIRSEDGTVRKGGLIYKSDLARDNGYNLGSASGMKEAINQTYSYQISLYSEGPYYRNVGRGSSPYFPGSSQLVEKSGTFKLPRC